MFAFWAGPELQSLRDGNQVVITLPRAPVDENDAVIVLELDGSTEGIAPLDVPTNVFKEVEVNNVKLKTPPSPTYSANGVQSLVDKVRGTPDFHDGNWLGFEQEDCEAVIDLQSAKMISGVAVGCLQAQGSWIFLPKAVEVSVSENGTEFRSVGKVDLGDPKHDEEFVTKDFPVSFSPVAVRFVKIRVANVGVCPAWHKGAGGKAWVFVDEIMIISSSTSR